MGVVTYHNASGRRILHTTIRAFESRLSLSDDLRSSFVSFTFSFKSRWHIFWSFSELLQKFTRTVHPSPLNLFCISHCKNCISFVTETTQTCHTQYYVLYIPMVLDHLVIYIQHALFFNRPISWPNCDFHIRKRQMWLWTTLKFPHVMLRKTKGLWDYVTDLISFFRLRD